MGLHMNYHRFKKKVLATLVVMPTMLGVGFALAQDTVIDTSGIDRVTASAGENIAAAAETQVRINRLSDQADELMEQFAEQAKIVDGLEVYNAQMRRTIDEQLKTIAQYDVSIEEVAELQRQVAPLMERMMVALEQFVELDVPFQLEDRKARLALIRDTFDDANVNIAEKFRLVLTAYQQEINYGRVMQHYTGTLQLDGVERDVDFLRVGRVALMYQTSDQTSTGVWDKNAKQFVELGSEYRRPVAKGIQMAQQLATTEILELPIHAPE
jgi:hypothetical protein